MESINSVVLAAWPRAHESRSEHRVQLAGGSTRQASLDAESTVTYHYM